MKYLVLLFSLKFCIAHAGSLYEQDCSGGIGYPVGGSVSLNIDTAFNGQTNFRLNRIVSTVESEKSEPKEEIEYALIINLTNTVLNEEKRTSSRTTTCTNLKITKAEYEKTLKLFKNAFNINFFDDVQGLDGSTWCIEINGVSQERKFCFWSPEYESKNRNLEALNSLGDYLLKSYVEKK